MRCILWQLIVWLKSEIIHILDVSLKYLQLWVSELMVSSISHLVNFYTFCQMDTVILHYVMFSYFLPQNDYGRAAGSVC